jgi:hypothetical protein
VPDDHEFIDDDRAIYNGKVIINKKQRERMLIFARISFVELPNESLDFINYIIIDGREGAIACTAANSINPIMIDRESVPHFAPDNGSFAF